MNVRIGKLYENKTWKYLTPCLAFHGKAFVDKFNNVFKLGVFIHDTLNDGASITKNRLVYIMLDKFYQKKDYQIFLEFIKTQEYYVGEYCPDSNFIDSRKHIIMLKVPEEMNHAYDKFLEGKYSEMYTKDQLKNLEEVLKRYNSYDVLTKTNSALESFAKEVSLEFEVECNIEELRNAEYDFPLLAKQEVLNFNSEEKLTTYYNKKLKIETWE